MPGAPRAVRSARHRRQDLVGADQAHGIARLTPAAHRPTAYCATARQSSRRYLRRGSARRSRPSAFELGGEQLASSARSTASVVDDDQPISRTSSRHMRAHRAAVHLAVDLLRELRGLAPRKALPPPRQIGLRMLPAGRARCPSGATACCRRRGLPRASSAPCVPGAPAGEVRRDHLVDERLVELGAAKLRRRPRRSPPS